MASYRWLVVTDKKGKNHDVTVVGFVDSTVRDGATIRELGEELFQLVDEENRDKIVINFSKVDSLPSIMLGKLITLDKKVKARGGKLKLCRLRPEFYSVFAIAKLDKVFDIKADEDETVDSF